MNDAPLSTVSNLVLAIFRANGTMLDWGDRFVAADGLTSARWQMLGALALASTPQTAPQLAQAMGISRQGAQKQLNLLLEARLIEKRDNPASLRSPLYRLTKSGDKLFLRVNSRWLEHAETLAARLSERDLHAAAQVVDLLARLHADTPGEEE